MLTLIDTEGMPTLQSGYVTVAHVDTPTYNQTRSGINSHVAITALPSAFVAQLCQGTYLLSEAACAAEYLS